MRMYPQRHTRHVPCKEHRFVLANCGTVRLPIVSRWMTTMDHAGRPRRWFLPAEVIMVLAVNVVLAAFGYYAFALWAMFSN